LCEGESNVAQPHRRTLNRIVLVALLVRLAVAAVCYRDVIKPRRDHWPFGYETGRIARAVALGRGFADPLFGHTGPTAWMTPGYPYLLAGIFKLFGVYSTRSALVILALQAVFAALTCIPLYLLALHWCGQQTALWTAWTWALFPYSIYLSSDFVWESTLTTLLVTLLLWLTVTRAQSRWRALWPVLGLLWGLTALVNPAPLAVLPLLAGWMVLQRHRAGLPWRAGLSVVLALLVLTVLPWELRNYRLFHRWIPLRDNFWLEVAVGNNWKTIHGWPDDGHPSSSPEELEAYQRLGEIPYMDVKRAQALAFIRQHPVMYLRLILRRVAHLWTGYWNFAPAYLAEEPYDRLNILFATPLTLLCLVGWVAAWRQGIKGSGLVLGVFLLYPLVYYLTHTNLRYRHPLDPEIALFAAYGVLAIRQAVGVPVWVRAAVESAGFTADKP
jgi:4-amino-4-deoxy-L-arabinose transferase-like glycosyltransferase